MMPSREAFRLSQLVETLELAAYPDPATGGDPWTIGYGHTGPEVKPGLVWDADRADNALARDLSHCSDVVNKAIGIAIPQSNFDAFCVFVLNVGGGAFNGSTMLRLYRAGDIRGAADQFKRWDKAGKPLRPMLGLKRRREAERQLYLGQTAEEAYRIGWSIRA